MLRTALRLAPRLTLVAASSQDSIAMQLPPLQKNQKLALAAAAGVAAALVIRRKLRTKIRAAFDIGSGEHKLVVAAVNGTSVKVLHSEVSTVLLAQDLTRPGGDGALSAGALRAS